MLATLQREKFIACEHTLIEDSQFVRYKKTLRINKCESLYLLLHTAKSIHTWLLKS